MNRSTFRKILGDIMARKGRTALVSISIFIGVLGVVVLVTASDLLISQLNEDVKPEELPMVTLFVSVTSEEKVDNAAALQTLSGLPDVTEVQAQSTSPIFWKKTDSDRFREYYLHAFSEPFSDMELRPVKLIEGEYPRPGRQELAVEIRMAEDQDLDVGDKIDVRVLGDPEHPDGTVTETWTISGIVFHPYNDQTFRESMFANFADAQLISNISGYSYLMLRYESFELAEDGYDTLLQTVRNETPYVTNVSFTQDPEDSIQIEGLEELANVLVLLAIIAMSVSGFLVINVITNLVVEQKKQIGVMKSLGTTRGETLMIYGGIVFTYGLIGMIPAVILGIPLGYEVSTIIGDLAGTYVNEFSVSPVAIALGISLGIGIPVLSAFVPVYSGTRVSILEAMTDLGISGGYKVGPIANLVNRLPIPATVKQSLNNLNQRKSRLSLTVFTLMLAVAAFMGVTAVFVNLDRTIDNLVSTLDYEFDITTTSTQDLDEIRQILHENVEEVDDIYPAVSASAQVEGYQNTLTNNSQLILIGIEPEAEVVNLDLLEGDGWEKDPNRHGTVITNEVADQLDLGPGDTLTFSLAGQEYSVEVLGVTNYLLEAALMPWEYVAEISGYVSDAPTPNEYFTSLTLPDYQGTLPENQVMAWGINEEVANFLAVDTGRTLGTESNEVLISEAMATNGNYQPGDVLEIDNSSYAIAGIFVPPTELAQNDIPPDVIALFWRELASLEGRPLTGKPSPNLYLVAMEGEDPTAEEVDDAIEEANDALLANGITSTIVNHVEEMQQLSEGILSIGIIMNMASLVMAAVGAIGLLTTLSISVFERQKEIGVMRSVGAKSPVIITQFLIEGLLVGLLAWLIAIPLGLVVALGLNEALPYGQYIQFEFPIILIPVGLVGVLIIASVSSIWPSLMAARKTVSEILRYQ